MSNDLRINNGDDIGKEREPRVGKVIDKIIPEEGNPQR